MLFIHKKIKRDPYNRYIEQSDTIEQSWEGIYEFDRHEQNYPEVFYKSINGNDLFIYTELDVTSRSSTTYHIGIFTKDMRHGDFPFSEFMTELEACKMKLLTFVKLRTLKNLKVSGRARYSPLLIIARLPTSDYTRIVKIV